MSNSSRNFLSVNQDIAHPTVEILQDATPKKDEGLVSLRTTLFCVVIAFCAYFTKEMYGKSEIVTESIDYAHDLYNRNKENLPPPEYMCKFTHKTLVFMFGCSIRNRSNFSTFPPFHVYKSTLRTQRS